MAFSRDLILNKNIEIPSEIDDHEIIDDFVKAHSDKKIVVVQGLGFVGAVMSVVCASADSEEYAVIGVDLPTENAFWKVSAINEGRFPIVAEDPEIERCFQTTQTRNNFIATTDPYAYCKADIVVVDVNLDVKKKSTKAYELSGYDVNLGGFEAAVKSIGSRCKPDALILIETTVPPGTTENIVIPAIHNGLKKRGFSHAEIKIGHSYERVMPGPDYIRSVKRIPRVFSGYDDDSANCIRDFLETIIDTEECHLTRLEHTTATEMAKVLENSYRAMNIAFMVEWSRFAEEAGVDLFGIVDAIRVRPTHSNLMYPGIGVGGYCLTKDPLLASWARQSFFKGDALKMTEKSVSVNDQMPRFAHKRLVEVYGDLQDSSVLCLGVTYRGDVADTRFSPVGPFFSELEFSGSSVKFYDPYISHWEDRKLQGLNLSEIESGNFDVVVLSAGHSVFQHSDFIEVLMKLAPLTIFDPLGFLSFDNRKILSAKHKLHVLGRGDCK